LEVVAVPIEAREIEARGLRAEQCLGDFRMPRAQPGDLHAIAVVLTLRQRHQAEQSIRDALARRKHDADARSRQGIDDGGDAPEAAGVGNAGAAEFVHDPGSGIGHGIGIDQWEGGATLLTSPSARNDVRGIIRAMDDELGPLLPLFERERAAGRAVALGILVHTAGSTYRKAGAMWLITGGGEYGGLLSGGCLEGDLGERACAVIATGRAALVTYDLRNSDDLVWGLGLGCEGAMHILLLRVGPAEEWQPLAHLAAARAAYAPTAVGVVTESMDTGAPLGALVLPDQAKTGEPTLRALPAKAAATLVQPRVRSALAAAPREATVGTLQSQDGRWRLLLLPLALPP